MLEREPRVKEACTMRPAFGRLRSPVAICLSVAVGWPNKFFSSELKRFFNAQNSSQVGQSINSLMIIIFG